MKDIFDLIDEIEVNEDDMEEMDVSEFEKERIKQSVKKAISKKKYKKSGLAAAAICFAIIGGIGVLGMINPTYAADMPIVGDIFRFLDNGRTGAYDKYKENSDEINITKESNGITVTIRDAVFEGNTVTYTYEINSDRDFDRNPIISGLEVKGYEDEGYGESSHSTKVGENTYVGQSVVTYDGAGIDRDDITCIIEVDSIPVITDSKRDKIKGKWDFKFDLHRVESIEQNVNHETEKDGMRCRISKIHKTPMSFTIEYSMYFDDDIVDKMIDRNGTIEEKTRQEGRIMCGIVSTLEIKDDLGNIYTGNSLGENAASDDMSSITYNNIFGQLNPEATKLIITPKFRFRDNSEVTFSDPEDDIFFNGNDLKGKEIIFDDILVDLDK